jgi:Cu+-exporting ATPase
MDPEVVSDHPADCPKCGMALERNPSWAPEAKVIYTCPMHPEVQQDHPGDCPKCGMALEPKAITAEPKEENSEARDMTRRFWIGAALSTPILLLAMGHLVPGFHIDHLIAPRFNQWVQFLLATPVVLWCGWPFLVRGLRSVLTRHLNMFTLISLGVGAAYVFSVAALLLPGAFPAAFRVSSRAEERSPPASAILLRLHQPQLPCPSSRLPLSFHLRRQTRPGVASGADRPRLTYLLRL